MSMWKPSGRLLAAGAAALAIVVAVAVLASFRKTDGQRCPSGRAVMQMVSLHAGPFPDVSDAVSLVARNWGYDPLTDEDRERIAEASTAAIAASTGGEITVAPDLRDTDAIVDLIVRVQGSEETGYDVTHASMCARVASIDESLATVVVATEDIPNGALLDPLIERGVFVEVQIPRYALIEDAVTDVQQLRGLRTVSVIVRNEQISPYRLMRPGVSD